MKQTLWLFCASLAALAVGTGLASAEPVLPGENVAEPITSILPSALDPLMTDVAVTDDQLSTTGVTVDAVPTLLIDPNMLVVDDDGVQCPNADFTSINAAVAAAMPGGTIRVCPGLYKESVPIVKAGLTLQAPRQQGQATECKAPAMPDPTKNAILSYNTTLNGGNPSVGFQVQADNVTIEGFTVQPDPALVTQNGVGIFADRFHAGYDIRHNVVQQNTIGVYVNSNGSAPTYVRENCVRNNVLPGAASSNGIYSDQGLQDAKIEDNYLTGHQNASILIDTFLTTPRNIEITHNESVDDSTILVANSEDVIVNYNKITNPTGSGIVTFVTDAGEVSFNQLVGGPNSFNGISFNFTTEASVKSNKVSGFMRNGIRFTNHSNGNTAATNRSVNNALAGLQATGQSSGNTFRENHMRGNTPDCSDTTTGSGTAGTANFWINDFGFTEDHPGICKHAA